MSPGQEHDVTKGSDLIQDCRAKKVLADKAYASDDLIAQIQDQRAVPVVPPRASRTEPRAYDREEYKKRNVVERFSNVPK